MFDQNAELKEYFGTKPSSSMMESEINLFVTINQFEEKITELYASGYLSKENDDLAANLLYSIKKLTNKK